MKRKTMKSTIVVSAVALAVCCGLKGYERLSSAKDSGSSILAANVEALTLPENWGYKIDTGICPPPLDYKKWVTCTFGRGKEYTQTDCMNSEC